MIVLYLLLVASILMAIAASVNRHASRKRSDLFGILLKQYLQ